MIFGTLVFCVLITSVDLSRLLPQCSCCTLSNVSTSGVCRTDTWRTTSSSPWSRWSQRSCTEEHENRRTCPHETWPWNNELSLEFRGLIMRHIIFTESRSEFFKRKGTGLYETNIAVQIESFGNLRHYDIFWSESDWHQQISTHCKKWFSNFFLRWWGENNNSRMLNFLLHLHSQPSKWSGKCKRDYEV